MSQAESKSHSSATTGKADRQPSAVMVNGKASALAPKLSDDNDVELENMLPVGPVVPADQDIMQLARLGDIAGIQKLYDSGAFTSSYCDGEGITPLHVSDFSPSKTTRYADPFAVGSHK
jgi:hypothetical protein